jgi:hypothetical protein
MGVSETWVKQQVIINIWWVPLLLALVVILSYLPWRYLRFALAIRPND